MEKIEKLKKDYDNKRKELFAIKEAIEEIETNEILPELRKKYEGKFFKFKNSCDGEEWWWLYIYCRKVENENWGIVDRFQTSIYQNEFIHNKSDILSSCNIEITREEYQKAFDEFSNKLSELKRIY